MINKMNHRNQCRRRNDMSSPIISTPNGFLAHTNIPGVSLIYSLLILSNIMAILSGVISSSLLIIGNSKSDKLFILFFLHFWEWIHRLMAIQICQFCLDLSLYFQNIMLIFSYLSRPVTINIDN